MRFFRWVLNNFSTYTLIRLSLAHSVVLSQDVARWFLCDYFQLFNSAAQQCCKFWELQCSENTQHATPVYQRKTIVWDSPTTCSTWEETNENYQQGQNNCSKLFPLKWAKHSVLNNYSTFPTFGLNNFLEKLQNVLMMVVLSACQHTCQRQLMYSRIFMFVLAPDRSRNRNRNQNNRKSSKERMKRSQVKQKESKAQRISFLNQVLGEYFASCFSSMYMLNSQLFKPELSPVLYIERCSTILQACFQRIILFKHGDLRKESTRRILLKTTTLNFQRSVYAVLAAL